MDIAGVARSTGVWITLHVLGANTFPRRAIVVVTATSSVRVYWAKVTTVEVRSLNVVGVSTRYVWGVTQAKRIGSVTIAKDSERAHKQIQDLIPTVGLQVQQVY